MTPIPYLDHLKRLCSAATPGPWEKVSDLPDYGVAAIGENARNGFDPDPVITLNRLYRAPWRKNYGCAEYDAAFIAASRTALPRLIEALEVAMEALENVEFQTRLYMNEDERRAFEISAKLAREALSKIRGLDDSR